MSPRPPQVTFKQGWLRKKGEKRHNWKKRWFVLSLHQLTYHEQQGSAVLKLFDLGEYALDTATEKVFS